MKKVSQIMAPVLVIVLLYLTLRVQDGGSLTNLITLGVIGMLFLSYFYFEKSKMGPKEIALIATLAAIAAAARVVFAPFPNIKPTTFIVAISGLVFGPYEGFLVGSTSAFISNIFLGQGPWTPWQMIAWGIVGVISGFLGKSGRKISTEKFAIICFLYGFVFDWVMNLWHVLGFVRPINLGTIALAYISGLTFDIMHAVGNFVFTLVFYQNFVKVLNRFKKRMEITYVESDGGEVL